MNVSNCALTFNMAAGRLTGELVVNDKRAYFNASAGAGGRAGSTTPGAIDPDLLNNPFATGVKGIESGGQIVKVGGPLPLGIYKLKTHESKPNWIRLEPLPGTSLLGRDGGFAIHRRGRHGSIGCIVPSDSNVVIRLYSLLAEIEDLALPAPWLKVVAEGSDMDRFLKVRTV